MNNETRKLKWNCSVWTSAALFRLHKLSSAQSLSLYLDVSSICGAEVRHGAAVDRHHGDRGNQGVRQRLLPVLQPLDKLGDLQAILAFFPLVDSLVRVTIIRGALENQTEGMNKTESLPGSRAE